jgi:hypothetical protein
MRNAIMFSSSIKRMVFPNHAPVIIALIAFVIGSATGQTNEALTINLQLNYAAAEQSVQLFEDQFASTQELAELRGNRIAAATTGLIENRGEVGQILRSYLDSLKYHERIKDDVYNLDDARKSVVQIKELLVQMKKSNFNRRVIATVVQLFPADVRINVSIPVYIIALGHENVEAYVRRIVWHGDAPEFVGEGKGEVTIVLNLAQAVRFHPNINERFLSLLSTVAHETFHAVFGAYKDRSPAWKEYYAKHGRAFDNLLDLTQNEGIAYYLSLQEAWHGSVPPDWSTRLQDVFSTFNKNAAELLSDRLTARRAADLIRTANLSGYWESYGAMTGMCMARAIDQKLGRNILIETVSQGPSDFFLKYDSISTQDGNFPRLNPAIMREIR